MARFGVGGGGFIRGGASVGRGGIRGGVGVGPFSLSGGSRRRRSSGTSLSPEEAHEGFVICAVIVAICLFLGSGTLPAVVGVSALFLILANKLRERIWNKWSGYNKPNWHEIQTDLSNSRSIAASISVLAAGAVLLAIGVGIVNSYLLSFERGPSTLHSEQCITSRESIFGKENAKTDLTKIRLECERPAENWFELGSRTSVIVSQASTIIGVSSFTLACAIVVCRSVRIRRTLGSNKET
jgi:hypothetical protein